MKLLTVKLWYSKNAPSDFTQTDRSVTAVIRIHCCYTDRSVSKLLKRISIRLSHFTMDAYAGSVRFSDQGPSQIWKCIPKQIPSQFGQQLKGKLLDGLLKRKESKADLKLPGAKQSRKSIRQWFSHRIRRKWPLWTGGREWRPHAPCELRTRRRQC